MIRKALTMIAVIMAIGCTAQFVWSQDADRLGKDLTPAGGEKAGNKAGTIPVWSGKDVPLPGWSYGKFRGDYWQYKNEKPLFSIDASNVDKYSDKLSPGQVQMIKQTKGYRMDVYPTHRNGGYPDWIYANIKKNATEAKLSADGTALGTANLPGVPFPVPKNGAEVMWNFLMRYCGVGILWQDTNTVASPRPGGSDWINTHGPQSIYEPWAAPGSHTPASVNNVLYSIYFAYLSPPALAGQAVALSMFTNNADNETYYYFPGQRRVRRMPSYSYDAPQIGFEGEYTVDQPFVFNSTLDRFDWKIVSKKEMYIPYNCFGMYDFREKLHDVLLPRFLKNESRRYELHRVWVVEATVRKGMRHVAPRRLFYVDEDSWLALVSDDYDAQGKLWLVREGFPIPIWEIGGAFDLRPFVQYDLINGRYVQDQSVLGTGHDVQYFATSNKSEFNRDYYTADNLRARCQR